MTQSEHTTEALSSEPASEPNKAFETENARREREAPLLAAAIVSGDKAGEVADLGAPEDDFTRATKELFAVAQKIEALYPSQLCGIHPPAQIQKEVALSSVNAIMLLLTEVRALKRSISGT